MYRETIIIIIVIVLIIIGNIITQNNTAKTAEEISSNLSELRNVLIENDKNKGANEKIEEIEKTWEEEYDKLAYYVEHEELEKVETELKKLKADIEVEDYKRGVENLDNCIFVLGHIKDKNSLKIVNIF